MKAIFNFRVHVIEKARSDENWNLFSFVFNSLFCRGVVVRALITQSCFWESFERTCRRVALCCLFCRLLEPNKTTQRCYFEFICVKHRFTVRKVHILIIFLSFAFVLSVKRLNRDAKLIGILRRNFCIVLTALDKKYVFSVLGSVASWLCPIGNWIYFLPTSRQYDAELPSQNRNKFINSIAPCNRSRNPESKKVLLLESGI